MKRPKTIRKVVEKPFADNTMSNSAFFGMIRSALRQKSRWFKSISVAKERAKVSYIGPNKKRKWMYKCELCKELVSADFINVHHKNECGSLSSFEDLPGFTKRLFCNSDELITICNNCHDIIHGKNQ